MKKEITHKERIFLTKCLQLYPYTNVQWKALFNEGLSRSEIHRIAKELRKRGFIIQKNKNRYYNLNSEKVEEVKQILKNKIDEDNKRFVIPVKNILCYSVIVLIVLLIAIFFNHSAYMTSIEFGNITTIMVPYDVNKTYSIDDCSHLGNGTYKIRYLDKENKVIKRDYLDCSI
ncbi:MAG: hypothetical protein AABX29_07455 [Nanoarchaeota archaeon]